MTQHRRNNIVLALHNPLHCAVNISLFSSLTSNSISEIRDQFQTCIFGIKFIYLFVLDTAYLKEQKAMFFPEQKGVLEKRDKSWASSLIQCTATTPPDNLPQLFHVEVKQGGR